MKYYSRFTDQVEPYGMDECWLDVTATAALKGEGVEIAERSGGRSKKSWDYSKYRRFFQ